MVWGVLANSVFLVTNQAAQQLGSFALLAQGWEFQWTGLSVVPFVLATGMVFVIVGGGEIVIFERKWSFFCFFRRRRRWRAECGDRELREADRGAGDASRRRRDVRWGRDGTELEGRAPGHA